MELEYVIVGPIVLFGSGVILLNRAEIADMLYRYYNRVSDPDAGPWWRRGNFKPSEQQAMMITVLFSFAIGVLGIAFLLVGLGADW